MKSFVKTARQVCHSWRAIIDSTYRSQFYFARAELAYHYELSTRRPRHIVDALLEFRCQLNRHQDRDLVIVLIWDVPFAAEIAKRLFIHGILFIAPYAKQIRQACVDIAVADLCHAAVESLVAIGQTETI